MALLTPPPVSKGNVWEEEEKGVQENVLLRGQCHQAMMLLILCLLLAPRWVGRGTRCLPRPTLRPCSSLPLSLSVFASPGMPCGVHSVLIYRT